MCSMMMFLKVAQDVKHTYLHQFNLQNKFISQISNRSQIFQTQHPYLLPPSSKNVQNAVHFNSCQIRQNYIKLHFQLMGNTECCHVSKQDDNYSSQIVSPVEVHHTKKQTPEIQQPTKNQKLHNHHEPQIKSEEQNSINIQVVDHEQTQIPFLANNIRERVDNEKYFEQHFQNKKLSVKRYGSQVYQGELDADGKYPHGWGRMYKNDGSFYVGHFQNGKAEGQGAYLNPQGLVYRGHFHNNFAQGEGKMESPGLTYEGHFVKNLFQGEGKEKTESYEFEGEYYQGNKTRGIFRWTDQNGKDYIYNGQFNFKNQFHGEGILSDPNGTYSGSFIDGLKEGKGIYKYKTGLRYEGDYLKGVKKGKGIIYNFNNSIAYEGEFDHDMPHGQGFVYDSSGVRHQTTWVDGIDNTFL